MKLEQGAGEFALVGFPGHETLVLPEGHLEPVSPVDFRRQLASGPDHGSAARRKTLRDRQLQGWAAMLTGCDLRDHWRRPKPDHDVVRIAERHRLRYDHAETPGDRDRSILGAHHVIMPATATTEAANRTAGRGEGGRAVIEAAASRVVVAVMMPGPVAGRPGSRRRSPGRCARRPGRDLAARRPARQ